VISGNKAPLGNSDDLYAATVTGTAVVGVDHSDIGDISQIRTTISAGTSGRPLFASRTDDH
jgi:hypothetical protein